MRSFEQAQVIWDALVETNPGSAEFQNRRATNLGARGRLRLQIGENAAGRSDLRHALAIMESSPTQTSLDRYNQACFRSILSGALPAPETAATTAEARDDADRAMRTLQRAVAAGFRDVHHLRNDPDLAPIRSRSDFQRLLMELEFPADPFVP